MSPITGAYMPKFASTERSKFEVYELHKHRCGPDALFFESKDAVIEVPKKSWIKRIINFFYK